VSPAAIAELSPHLYDALVTVLAERAKQRG
jgi:hypothetical protein